MDVDQVLQNTLSPDASTRHNAEQQLSKAAEQNFSQYVTVLAESLSNDATQTSTRSAAGLALKNAFSARDASRLRDLQQQWLQQTDAPTRKRVKDSALKTLASKDLRAGAAAAQLVAAIAAIELPRNLWPELMPTLVASVGEGEDHHKQSSLATIGFICDTDDIELRESLSQHSNAILTAVVQGARKEETNLDVRYAAITALSDSLDFVRTNFDNEGERNYIMQVICEATQSGDSRVEAGSYGCLNRIMSLYYNKMRFYMEKALFGLTIMGMKNQEEEVAKLAIEFWCTVCEEEIAIEDDNALATQEGTIEHRELFKFAAIAAREVVPVLLELLTQQDEDAGEDEYNVSRAAYQCLQLFAQTIASDLLQMVLTFVEQNIRHEDWHKRDAAVSAFGAIMEGPDEQMLEPLVKQALPVLIAMMNDSNVQVKDSAAYAIGRVCENVSGSIDPQQTLPSLISALFSGLASNPRMANSCCWALMNLADRFTGELGAPSNALSPHFQDSMTHLLRVTESATGDNSVRTAAYEVLNTFVTTSANDSLPLVAKLSDVILERLEGTIPMQSQVVSMEDRMTLEEIQTSLISVLIAITQRLEVEVKPQADRIMQILLELLGSARPKSSVPDSVFGAVGALTNALEQDFVKYMEPFVPFLYSALGKTEEPEVCAIAVGLVSDLARSLNEAILPYCDSLMNHLLETLQRSTTFSTQVKPAVLQCFGDIAQAIGNAFQKYLETVATVLRHASSVKVSEPTFEFYEYVTSLREGIMDGWGGIVLALKQTNAQVLRPYVESIFNLLNVVSTDENRTEGLLRASMGVIGDLAEAFPNGEYHQFFQADWVARLILETRKNREFAPRTIETARWAREQVKLQQNMRVQSS